MAGSTFSRRQFLKVTAAGAAWSMSAASYARIMGSNAKLQLAFIGADGINNQHMDKAVEFGAGCPVFCDVDRRRWGGAKERWPDAVGYTDYRRLYDERHKDIDAVMVGTPDHSHYPATIIGMMLGKHAYTQKPLTHTVWEARQLRLAMERYKVATQMGNQGHAEEGIRSTIAHIRAKTIGDVVEAHVWTDRPWWRQGIDRPAGREPVPADLDWDAWLGPAPERPFLHTPKDDWGGLYHPFNWRGWWDFGCGALGDMACHDMDPFYWALEPGYPTSVELIDTEPFGDQETYAPASTVRFEFPAKGDRPAFTAYWYDGGRKPARPDEMPEGVEFEGEGALIVGTRGKIVNLKRGLDAPMLLPRQQFDGMAAPASPIEPSEGHHLEWFRACTGDAPYDHPKANFRYSGPFTEAVLLGCIAQRLGGKLRFDGERFTNNNLANDLLTKPYREGWEFRI